MSDRQTTSHCPLCEGYTKRIAELEAEIKQSDSDVERIEIDRSMIPEGAVLLEAYLHNSALVVMHEEALGELGENHNCDEMGCGTGSHVWARIPLDAMSRISQLEAERDALKARVTELKDEMSAVIDEVCVVGGLHDSTPNAAGTPVPLEPSPHALVANAISNLRAERDALKAELKAACTVTFEAEMGECHGEESAVPFEEYAADMQKAYEEGRYDEQHTNYGPSLYEQHEWEGSETKQHIDERRRANAAPVTLRNAGPGKPLHDEDPTL